MGLRFRGLGVKFTDLFPWLPLNQVVPQPFRLPVNPKLRVLLQFAGCGLKQHAELQVER